MVRVCAVVALCALVACASAVDTSSRFQPRKRKTAEVQPEKQAEVDEMVNNLLHWIQGIYQQNNRKARQYFGGKPEKPRPFEPSNGYLPPATGYPPSGTRPSPPYTEGPAPSNPLNQPSPTYKPSEPTYQPESSYKPSGTEEGSYQSSLNPSLPTQSSYQPSQPSYQPSQPSQAPYQPSQPSYQPSQSSQASYQPSPSTPGYQPSQPSYQPSQPSYQPVETTESLYVPLAGSGSSLTSSGSSVAITGSTSSSSSSSSSGSFTSDSSQTVTQTGTNDDDDRHPPHIHDITVDCGKEMMTINIEFNKPYNGLIYSQDHFSEPDCVYVRESSNRAKFSFTVSLNTCGTRFFSDFENEGQAYLENVLVLQNEAGIQEVWDHIRRVRCLWEGNLKKQLISSLSVGMLNQITSNFSGDTAMARLDIQSGKGPFAPEANGLIKIGETMTLVVSVTGDPGFDILVRECIARDSESRHVVPLTDSNGCVLKPKVFGAFQKTKDTGNTGASIIAYAYFNAFKFPDEMDLIIQCEVELCKTDCDVCPSPGSYEPRRRRRDVVHIGNRTLEPTTTIAKGLRVVFAEDLPEPSGFCVSPPAALWGGMLVLLGSLLSSLLVSYCWQKSRGSVKFT